MRMHNSLTARFLRPLPPTFHLLLCVMLLVSAGLLDLLLLDQQRDMGMGLGMGMDGGRHGETIGQAIMWLMACRLLPLLTACVAALILLRMIRSAHQQRTQTQAVLCPLLEQPTFAPPAHLVSLLQTLGLEQRTRLIGCDFPVALCYGVLHPRLLLSSAVLSGLSPLELEAVLRHEQVHLLRRDPLRRLFLRALRDALPLTALQDIAEAAPLAQELAADRVVLATVGTEALSGALLKIGDVLGTLEQAPTESGNRRRLLAVGAFGSIDARIDQILGEPIPRQRGAASMVQPLLVLALLASGPLLCVLLPFPASLFWIAGVALAVSWRQLRVLPQLLTRQKL